MENLKTSDVAERTGVNIHTVRYYEKRGLLPEPPRSASGYRQYGHEHVTYINFIKRAQELGFTLEEISELLSLRSAPEGGTEVRARIGEKVTEIDAKIRDLRKIRHKLVDMADACNKHGSPSDCLVLHALEGAENPTSQ